MAELGRHTVTLPDTWASLATPWVPPEAAYLKASERELGPEIHRHAAWLSQSVTTHFD